MNWQHELLIKITLENALLFLLFSLTVIFLGITIIKRSHLRRREKLKEEIQEVIQEEIDSALMGK